MLWQANPYAIPMVISGVVALLVAAVTWRRRSIAGVPALALLGLCAGMWSLLYAVELSTPSRAVAIVLAKAEYVAIVLVPLAWLTFARHYAGRGRRLSALQRAAFAVVPIVTLLIAWTNEAHGLFWSAIMPARLGGLVMYEYHHGPWFWAHTAYAYGCMFAGSLLLVSTILYSPQIYRRQGLALLVAIVAPWAANAIYLINVVPWPYLDLTPLAFTFSAAVIALSILRLRLFDIVPVARGLVIEQMDDPMVVLDTTAQVIDINPAACAALKTTATAALGRPARELFGRWPDLVERYQGRAGIAEEIAYDGEDGRRWLDVRIAALSGRPGTLHGRVVVWRDVTARRQAEAELRAAKEAAELANRAKSVFLANMSHELRTPLTAVLGYCQLLELQLHKLDVEQMRDELRGIRQSGDHLLAMINSLLDLSRIEAGIVEMHWSEFDLYATVAESVMTSQPLIARNGNRVQADLDPGLGTIQADQVKLRQVLLNLLGNAAKFTEGGLITVGAARDHGPDGEWARVWVSDTGPGLTPAEVEQLFGAFSEGDPAKRRRFGGTGIGLAISQHYCRLMGGDLTAESAPGGGATFMLRIPARREGPLGPSTGPAALLSLAAGGPER